MQIIQTFQYAVQYILYELNMINKSKYINLEQFKIDEIALYKKKANEN